MALLDELGSDLDLEAVRDGKLTPVFFGSAANTFGVQLFLVRAAILLLFAPFAVFRCNLAHSRVCAPSPFVRKGAER